MSRRLLLGYRAALLALVGPGCVAGTRSYPSSYEAASGPPPEPAPPSAGQLLAPNGYEATPTRAPSRAGTKDAEAASGYWHWDGVEYVWVEREARPKKAPYTWR